MIEAATPSAPAMPSAPTQAPSTGSAPAQSEATQATDSQVLPTPEAKPERPKAKVGEVEWEQDEDGEWYSTQKVNGREERISHEKALSAARQMAASTERFQQAKAIERNVETMLAQAASSPRAAADFLTKLGVDVYELAEQILGEHIETSKLTPAERRARELEAELEAYKRQQAERERQEYETKAEAHARRTREAYVAAFDRELDALHAPKTPGGRDWLHRRIAQLANHAEDNGIPTSLQALTKQAAREFQEMAGTKWQAPQAQPVQQAQPRVVVPSQAQQPNNGMPRDQRNGQFVRRSDPKPRLQPGDPDSVRAIIEWEKRNKQR